MSKPDAMLAEKRAERSRARAEFQRRVGIAKVDLAPAVLKRRAMDEAQRKALSVTHQAIDIANDSRGVVAATVAALLLWLTRKPIIAGAGKLVQRVQARKAAQRSAGARLRLIIDDYWHKLKEYADE